MALCSALAVALALAAQAPARAKLSDPWKPIDPADLAMTSEPLAPGAEAIVLYREIEQDDLQGFADYYFRIKILTDDGKTAGNVEIPYYGAYDSISMISGRTIHTDGTIIPWQGKVIDQTYSRAHGVKELVKTFTMPDVQTGSIIEYRYRMGWDKDLLFRTTWIITDDLFTRQLHCTLTPYQEAYVLMWEWQGLPGNVLPSQGPDGMVHYDAQNVPGIQQEDYMPPEDAIEGKIDLFYTDGQTRDPNKYWKKEGKGWNDDVEHFVGRSSAIRDEAEKVAPASDPPETRLRKLYARTQQIRDLSEEPNKTAEEVKAENLKINKSAEEILKNGYARGSDINLFFIALARAAGFDADSVRVTNRALYFFNPRILDHRQLEFADVVLVKLNGQDLFLDPATPHAGFGQLPWQETGVPGLALDNSGGTFVTTTAPKSSDTVIERAATLQMGDDGWLQGQLVVTFSGQAALERRQAADRQDPADRTKSLTDEVTAFLPPGAALTLTNQPDWAGSDSPLRAEFSIKMKPVGATTGHLVLISENFFSDADLPRFDHPLRTYPIYFDHPFEYRDDVTLTLPLLLQSGNLPAPIDRSSPYGVYQLSCTAQAGALHFQHVVTLSGIYYPVQFYAPLRSFFDEARHADQQQVMLQVAGSQGTQARQ
jgi:hypothetical protein